MRLISTVLVLIFIVSSTLAQSVRIPERFTFEPELPYNSAIQDPASYLGYQIGEHFTLYANSVDYFKYLAESSDRITINQYGQTYEGRKLYNIVITSPENHTNIEALRADNLRLGDPRSLNEADANSIIDDKPVFLSYSYNIHGNEASSTEAAMQVSYRLAAATDAGTMDILNNAVLVFYICINPDGRDRYVYWYESVRRSVTGSEPADLEHYAPWPNGRTNHYWFDLNRDWIWGVHPESRGHTSEYLKWMPQLHTDYHEQGYNSNYFTMPGTTPRNMLLPDQYEALTDTIGKANVAAFDENQINYFTREAFDFFYPGYGSSYPTVMNAIGMLTEQGGIAGGTAIETNDGNILTLRQRAFDHYTTSIATIRKAVEQRQLFNRYTYESANPKNSKSNTTAYFIENNGDIYVNDVINVLLHHNVEVDQSTESFSVNSAYDYRKQVTEAKQFPAGTYIIKTDQPKHLFVNTVLSHQMSIEDSVMYDMATWSAPIAYNLDGYSTSSNINIRSNRVTEKLIDVGMVKNAGAQYAYVIDWNQRYAPKALSHLWQKGYNVRTSTKTFSDGRNTFKPGSLIILKGRNLHNKEFIETDIAEISQKCMVTIHGLNSGRMASGNDLGSRTNFPLKVPKVALLVDQPFSTYTGGQLYFLFDQDTELPVERIRASTLLQTSLPKLGRRYGYTDLNDYDVIILPGGGRNLSKVFQKEELAKLKQWVTAGGTLVATESAAAFLTSKQSKFTDVKLINLDKDSSDMAKYLSFEERRDYNGKKYIPGSAMLSHIDISHPLAFGTKETLFSLKFGSQALKPATGLQTVGYYSKDESKVLASGYAAKESLKPLIGNTFAAVQNMGQGKVVFLLDNTQYRMFWRGPSRMMQNAVMLVPSY